MFTAMDGHDLEYSVTQRSCKNERISGLSFSILDPSDSPTGAIIILLLLTL